MSATTASQRSGLQKLSSVLRSRADWPAGFAWDYTRPDHCAERIGRRLTNRPTKLAPDAVGGKIFVFADRYHPARPHFADVSPDHVADLIDMHLRGEL